MTLGNLTSVDLRKAWNHEAYDFTRWLSEETNLALLSDEIGIEIKFIESEASVGKFSVDILAEEENTGRKIIIENQLEKTNHDHLGKIITYASGYDAEIIIWIVEDVRDEHKQAIDWLNEHTDEKINFFAVKMELWQIGDSPYAPKFNIICKPNEWSKTIKNTINDSKLTDTKLLQLDFWNNFKDYCANNSSSLKLRKAYPQHWYDISLGSSEAHICLTVNSRENLITCEIYISDNKELFNSLRKIKEQIEKELLETLDWQALESKKACRIKLSKSIEFENTVTWQDSFKWMNEKAQNFQKVFGKFIQLSRQETSY